MLVATGVLCCAQSASAATLTVDDDRADCPAAAFTSVQAAVDAAAPGDTVTICPGTYAEGTGEVGTNAVLIRKNLTLKGAGADLVRITPKSSSTAGGQIMEATPDLRNGLGDIIAVVGTPSQPLKVDISGITVDGWDPKGRPVVVEAGVLFLDARGSVVRSHVTNVVTSEGDEAYLRPGGYRGTQPGIGIAQVTAALYAPVDGARRLLIERTRVDKYNKIGILIDGATSDAFPLLPSGTVDRGVIVASQVVGRNLCVNYQGTGACALTDGGPGGAPLNSGPLFGQDGLRVTAGSYATVESSTITQNLVLGNGTPVRGAATNNENLPAAAGVRYVGAKMNDYTRATGRVNYSHIAASNIIDNAYGAINTALDGTTPATGNPNASVTESFGNLLLAENNWWGLYDLAAANPGPMISPTTNPRPGENPVNGAATTETQSGGQTSDAVDFYPFRNGSQGHPTAGQYPVLTAPIAVDDAPPAVTLSAPAQAERGTTITLTASPSDDFGVKRVRFAEGSATLGTASVPPYTQSVALPAGAACDSMRAFGAVATDSANQTAPAKPVVVKVTCAPEPEPSPSPSPSPAAPTLGWVSWPSRLRGSAPVAFSATAAGGLKSIEVSLGARHICTITAAPYTCTVTATGADVGSQALTAVITDNLGRTAQVQRAIVVAKFVPTLGLKIGKRSVAGGNTRRTIRGTLKLPEDVTPQQGCSGSVTLVVTRRGRSLLNQHVPLSRSCTFSRSITAARSNQSFSVSAKFGGNAALSTANATRRFS